MKVLVVDDNLINRKLLRAILAAADHSAVEAEDGLAALEALKREKIDAIISDVLMPRMDGYRLCYELRKDEALADTPLILYTSTYNTPADEKVALDFGADKFIVKPAPPEVILNALYEVVENAQGQRKQRPKKPQELLAMREYSEALVRKLEEKNVELGEANEALQERAVLAEFNAKITNALTHRGTLREILQLCTEAMVRHLEAAFARIWTCNKNDNVLELQGSAGMYTHIDGGHARVPIGQFKIGLIASERQPHLTNAVIGDARVHDQEWAKREGMVAFAGYPLLVEDRLVGVMAMFARKALTLTVLQAMKSVAGGIAIGIEHKLAEETIRQSEQRFRELAENINEIFFVSDPTGSPVYYVSPAYEQITGRKCETLYHNPRAWLEDIHPDDRPRVEEALRNNPETLHAEYRIVRPDDTVRWLRSRAFPVKDVAGNVVRIAGIAENITEQKRAEEKVQENLERIRALHEIDKAITSTLDLQSVLNVLLEKMDLVLRYAATTVRLFNPENGLLEPVACRNLDAKEWKAQEWRGGRGIANIVFKTNLPLIIRNAQVDPSVRDTEFYRKHKLVSYLGLPLIAKEKTLGVMGFYTKEEHEFTNEEVEFLTTLAGQAAIAIHNAQLYEQTERHLERIRALHEIDLAISSTLDLKAVLEILLEKIDLFLPIAAATTVRLLNRHTGELESLACRGLNEKEWRAQQRTMPGGRAKTIVETKAPLVLRNIQGDARTYNPDIFRSRGLISYLGVPLIAKDEALGVLSLYTDHEHEFGKEEIEFLVTLAGQGAIAIQNAQLFEETEHSKKELERTNRYLEGSLKQLSGLYTALAPLTPSESIHETMGGIIERLLEATGADAGLIRVWDKEADNYRIAGHRGFPDHYLEQVWTSPPGGAADWVVKHGEPIIAPDIALEPRLKGKVQLELGLRSCAMLPLKVHNEVRGMMHIASHQAGYFDEAQKDHLTAIARQMNIALENRELFDILESSRDELERANKVKDEFLGVISHELRTPINVIMGYTSLFKEGVLGEIKPTQEEALKKISNESGGLLAMIDSILCAISLEAHQITLDGQEFSPVSLLAELRADYAVTMPRKLSLIWDYIADLPPIKSDRRKLKNILDNLINNAVKFTDQGHVAIAAKFCKDRGRRSPASEDNLQATESSSHAARRGPVLSQVEGPHACQWIEFKVADTGVGIPQEAVPFIFDKFYQVDSSGTRSYGGMGLGLYVVKQFTALLHGTVEVDSEVGKGSTFTVRIPTGG